jgi:hypothetical protein
MHTGQDPRNPDTLLTLIETYHSTEHNSTQLLSLQQLRRAGTRRWWRSCSRGRQQQQAETAQDKQSVMVPQLVAVQHMMLL